MHTSHHLTHAGSWLGALIAVNGFAIGDALREWVGVAIAVGCTVLSASIYASQLIYGARLKRAAAAAEYRREQELADAKHKRQMAELNGVSPGVHE
jgi:uncharacterized membrane-anchored protein